MIQTGANAMNHVDQVLGNFDETLTPDQINILMRNKREVYKQCCRRGYIMPPYTDSIICPTFILGVKDKEYWMLHQDNARPFRTIAELPTRK